MENGLICFDRVKIAKRYIRTFEFKVDIISLLPTDLIYYFAFPHNRRILSALRLNRLAKFSRLAEFTSITETETKYPTVFRMSNLLINILLAMHWNACIYFIVSDWIGFGKDEWVYPELVGDSVDDFGNNSIEQSELLTGRSSKLLILFYYGSQILSNNILKIF